MVLLNRIYTRQGDKGRSRLANGQQVSKASPRLEAIGAVDELNAHIGWARLEAGESALAAVLGRVQNDLFDLGADLATPAKRASGEPLRIIPAQVEGLEREIDALNAELPPLTSFILPGGGRASVALHLARTVCRRAERRLVSLIEDGAEAHYEALRYLNRLSDLLFVAARSAAAGGDTLWVPGANR
ncbi:MAG TPA: cob(I)yrinic acid a,c-diamide adenosyltransferase [Caulobacteraceae bacterium]|nr:cob(I)yrinic acid a,c-diamide adenosyltransferase [Caulobacteraceae bacterium]